MKVAMKEFWETGYQSSTGIPRDKKQRTRLPLLPKVGYRYLFHTCYVLGAGMCVFWGSAYGILDQRASLKSETMS